MLGSCENTSHELKPIKTETTDFNINTATQMIKTGEKIFADISIKDTISRHEFNTFLNEIDDAYNGYKEAPWAKMFFYYEEFMDEKITTLRLNKEMFYPTIYHKDVEIVSAQIINTYYQDEHLNTSILHIREEYLGDDNKLKDWSREYLYQKNDENKWVFYQFRGQINFLGDGITSDYLELKK
jgi:hypothetical protein